MKRSDFLKGLLAIPITVAVAPVIGSIESQRRIRKVSEYKAAVTIDGEDYVMDVVNSKNNNHFFPRFMQQPVAGVSISGIGYVKSFNPLDVSEAFLSEVRFKRNGVWFATIVKKMVYINGSDTQQEARLAVRDGCKMFIEKCINVQKKLILDKDIARFCYIDLNQEDMI